MEFSVAPRWLLAHTHCKKCRHHIKLNKRDLTPHWKFWIFRKISFSCPNCGQKNREILIIP